MAHSRSTLAIKIVANGRQRRVEVRGLGNVVDTHNAHVVGDAEAGFLQGEHGAQRHLVVGGDKGGGIRDLVERGESLVSGARRPVAVEDGYGLHSEGVDGILVGPNAVA